MALLSGESKVLDIPAEDALTHKLAGLLGAPMSAGEDMYVDLQKKYLPRAKSRSSYNPDYEFVESLEISPEEVRI